MSDLAAPTSAAVGALRRATDALHRRLEGRLDLERITASRGSYRRLLEGLYGLYAPLEAALARSPVARPGLGLDLGRRRKTPWLERDLRALGLGGGEIAALAASPATGLPAADTVPSALGTLYVLEGATLGGRVIGRALRDALGIDAGNGGRFHHGYGDATGRRWRALLDVLEVELATGEARRAASRAAVATFIAFDRHLGRSE